MSHEVQTRAGRLACARSARGASHLRDGLVLSVFLASASTVPALVPALALAPADDQPFDALADGYAKDVRPLLRRFCLGCHSTKTKEGDLDLEQFAAFADVRKFKSFPAAGMGAPGAL